MNWAIFLPLGFVWEFGGKGKGRVGNIGENGKIHIFWKSNFVENDKLMLMINIFLILRIW